MTMQRNPTSPSGFSMRNTIGVVIVAVVTPFCIRAAFTAATDDQHYISYPKNDGVGGPCETIFHPTNDVKIKQYAVQDQEFLSGLQALKDIVAKASSDGMRLRPIGTRWNMNNLPYSYEYMVETRELTYVKTGIDDTTYLTPNYQSGSSLPERLTFVQSGVTIRNLYAALFEKGLTLPTSAVTDGMTIGGGISTGAHNAGLDFGGMQDFVRGIHLVLDGRTVFVQPSTDPVVTQEYATAIGADVLTNDDALFYNALVSYGAYGIIHGFLIEPVELYQLDVRVNRLSLEDAQKALPALDFAALGFELNDPSTLPHHLDAYCNPYRTDGTACVVRVMEKRALSEKQLADAKASSATYQPKYTGKDPTTALGEAVTAQGLISYFGLLRFGPVGVFIKRLVYGMAAQSSVVTLVAYGGLIDGKGYPMEVYGDSAAPSEYVNLPVPSIAMELAMPLEDFGTILPIVTDLLDKHPAPIGLIIRFAKGSNATLAPNQYEGTNAYIELGGIQWLDSFLLYRHVIEALENRRKDSGLQFNYHMSKHNPEDDDFMSAAFGAAWSQWTAGRAGFLTASEQRLFSNDYTDLLGIS